MLSFSLTTTQVMEHRGAVYREKLTHPRERVRELDLSSVAGLDFSVIPNSVDDSSSHGRLYLEVGTPKQRQFFLLEVVGEAWDSEG